MLVCRWNIEEEKSINVYEECCHFGLIMISETVDLLTAPSLKVFKSWSGELRSLPNIKLRKYTQQALEALISGTCEANEHCSADSMEESDTNADDDDPDEEMSD